MRHSECIIVGFYAKVVHSAPPMLAIVLHMHVETSIFVDIQRVQLWLDDDGRMNVGLYQGRGCHVRAKG